jgi:hypothetical protein
MIVVNVFMLNLLIKIQDVCKDRINLLIKLTKLMRLNIFQSYN